jgi:hypothetical protein
MSHEKEDGAGPMPAVLRSHVPHPKLMRAPYEVITKISRGMKNIDFKIEKCYLGNSDSHGI